MKQACDVTGLLQAWTRGDPASGGGDQPVWRRDGAELFFAGPEGRLFAVSVGPDPPFDMLRAPRASRGANAGHFLGTATKLNVPPSVNATGVRLTTSRATASACTSFTRPI